MIKIYKTLIVPVKCNKTNYEYISTLNKLSAQTWNRMLEINQKYRMVTDGEWINRNQLQFALKGFTLLHAKGIQFVINKYLYARDAMLASRKKGTEGAKYPYRKKKFFNTGWDSQSVKVKNNKILLSKPNINGIRQKPIQCYIKNPPQNIVEVELIYKDKYYLFIKYVENKQINPIMSINKASIDLGEIHSITSIDSCGNALIVTGRKIRSIKYLRNKEQAKLRRKISKCKKGSRQYKKYMRALNNLKHKTDNKIKDCVHKITKLYLDYCLQNNISTVYYGDLDSATRSTKQKHYSSSFVRQKLSQWNFGEIVRELENKLSRYNIKLIKVKEYYTSRKCPSCNQLNKPKGRVYKCKNCNYKQHRDIVGAINILNDNSNFNLIKYNNFKYLQIS